jgi:hypothetical protein
MKALYYLFILSPILINAYVTLASYLWQKRCNEAIYAEVERMRRMRKEINS